MIKQESEKEYVDQKRAIIQEALRQTVKPFKEQPVLRAFQDQFKVICSRYSFLVAYGKSKTGKTVWAKNITGNPAEVY